MLEQEENYTLQDAHKEKNKKARRTLIDISGENEGARCVQL